MKINVEKQLPSKKNNEKQQYEKIYCEQGIISLFFVYIKKRNNINEGVMNNNKKRV